MNKSKLEKLLISEVTEEQYERLMEYYDEMGMDEDSIEEDIENDYLTTNIGNDGLRYLWYFDGSSELVIDPDGETVDSDGLF